MRFAYRQMNYIDIPSGVSLCRDNKWNQIARDWKLFLKLGPADCRVTTQNENITGTFTRDYYFNQIGPVVANSINQAKQLVAAALSNCNGQRVIVDTLLHDSGWIQWLKEIGFTEQRNFIRMYRGVNRYPGLPEKQFAIVGPEYV